MGGGGVVAATCKEYPHAYPLTLGGSGCWGQGAEQVALSKDTWSALPDCHRHCVPGRWLMLGTAALPQHRVCSDGLWVPGCSSPAPQA